ncbi:MAG: hypothetical protein KGO50_13710 [Myxococcales bacterium]|nr:hypothetical protein [Myxococcales bacterium]
MESVQMTVVNQAGERPVRVRVVDGWVVLRSADAEWRVPADLADGATLWTEGTRPWADGIEKAAVPPLPVKQETRR